MEHVKLKKPRVMKVNVVQTGTDALSLLPIHTRADVVRANSANADTISAAAINMNKAVGTCLRSGNKFLRMSVLWERMISARIMLSGAMQRNDASIRGTDFGCVAFEIIVDMNPMKCFRKLKSQHLFVKSI